MSTMIPDDVATLAGGPPPIGPPGAPPTGPPGPPMGDPGMGGGLPPELAGLLGGGPGGPPPPGMGGPEGMEPPGPEGGEAPNEIDQLSDILDGVMTYIQIASDDIEKAKMMKAAQIVQDLLASNQQEAEAAGGVGPAQKGMRKALAG